MSETVRIKGVRRSDRVASGVILCLLAGVAAGVFWKGMHPPPGETLALSGAGAASGGFEAKPALLGRYSLGGKRLFNEDTLYEYINGQAPRYVQFGFQALTVAEYSAQDPKAAPLVVDLYDMGSRRNAYGIFVDGRTGEESAAALGNEGYTSGNLAAFWKNRYYVRLRALTDNDAGEAVVKAAGEVATWIEDPVGGLEEFAVFPRAGLSEGGFAFQNEAAFGLAYLNEVFAAQYGEGNERYRLFFLRAATPEAAQAVLQEHAAFLKSNGGLEEHRSGSGEPLVWGREKYIGPTLLISRGAVVAGSIGQMDRERAEKTVWQVLEAAVKLPAPQENADGVR